MASSWLHPRTKYHLTASEAEAVFAAVPDAVLVRSEGMGFFSLIDCARAKVNHSTLTFRSCEALVKRGVIKLKEANHSTRTAYWVKA